MPMALGVAVNTRSKLPPAARVTLPPLAVADVLRGKALAYVLENAVVTDASGRTVDLNRLEQDVAAGSE